MIGMIYNYDDEISKQLVLLENKDKIMLCDISRQELIDEWKAPGEIKFITPLYFDNFNLRKDEVKTFAFQYKKDKSEIVDIVELKYNKLNKKFDLSRNNSFSIDHKILESSFGDSDTIYYLLFLSDDNKSIYIINSNGVPISDYRSDKPFKIKQFRSHNLCLYDGQTLTMLKVVKGVISKIHEMKLGNPVELNKAHFCDFQYSIPESYGDRLSLYDGEDYYLIDPDTYKVVKEIRLEGAGENLDNMAFPHKNGIYFYCDNVYGTDNKIVDQDIATEKNYEPFRIFRWLDRIYFFFQRWDGKEFIIKLYAMHDINSPIKDIKMLEFDFTPIPEKIVATDFELHGYDFYLFGESGAVYKTTFYYDQSEGKPVDITPKIIQ